MRRPGLHPFYIRWAEYGLDNFAVREIPPRRLRMWKAERGRCVSIPCSNLAIIAYAPVGVHNEYPP